MEAETTRFRRRLLGVALLGAMTLASAACEPDAASQKNGAEGAPPKSVQAETQEPEAKDTRSRIPADTFVDLTIGDPESLDPAWTYESQGMGLDMNLYDGLVAFKRERVDEYVPGLATDWTVSDDGLTYVFTIREDVAFHEGGTLEPHDAAYSLQRAMLQDRSSGPMWLFLQPLLGVSTIASLAVEMADLDLAEGDDQPAVGDLPAEATVAVCEAVKETVVADDEAGTVTLILATPAPWLPQLLAMSFGSVLDQEWMMEQGDWDGTCATWTEWHDPAAEESVLFDQANGTGPYRLASWRKNEAITLAANEDYWRTAPAWEGGPTGPPAIDNIVIQKVEEWGTRFTKLANGEADRTYVPLSEIDQVADLVYTAYEGRDESAPSQIVNPDGFLKLFRGYATQVADSAMFNFDIATAGGNELVGSGELDGQGIPADFFSDVRVRRGFNYCFDWDTYLADALQGDAVQTRGPIIAGLQGYRDDSAIYGFDLTRCEAELAEAWDGQLPETGFTLSVAYLEGSAERQAAAEILADGLSQVNTKYKVIPVRQQWPTLLDNMNNRRLPITFVGWFNDYADASNWAFAFLHSEGPFGNLMSLPPAVAGPIDALIEEGTKETDPARRDEIFAELQEMAVDEATAIFLHQWSGRTYMRGDVTGWYANPLIPLGGSRFYDLRKVSQ